MSRIRSLSTRARWASLKAALIVLSLPTAARADFVVATGVRWNPVNYTMPVSTSGVGMPTVLSGFNWTNLNNYFGMFFLDGRLGFHLSLDVAYSSRHDVTGPATTSDLSFTQVGFALGGKWYMTKPQGGHVSPYLYLDFYKYFALVSSSVMLPKGYEGFIGGLASPLGIDTAIGAEYFFTPAFSLGAEVFGLRYAYTFGDYSPVAGLGTSTVSETNHYLTYYTGITLNYRFEVKMAARGRQAAGEEEEEEQPRPKKRKAIEPTEPGPSEPPPAAESVD
jgi:hypothetical protein